MESLLSPWRMHWDHEPPQIEDENEDEDDLERFMDSFNDWSIMHWGHEPVGVSDAQESGGMPRTPNAGARFDSLREGSSERTCEPKRTSSGTAFGVLVFFHRTPGVSASATTPGYFLPTLRVEQQALISSPKNQA